ncbi:Uncharacterised protein [Mycobacteroides abscessus subsp. abscessus]|nr:Uncharacterised protein [Mycobacteroides abscessus subsp. abscessus]
MVRALLSFRRSGRCSLKLLSARYPPLPLMAPPPFFSHWPVIAGRQEMVRMHMPPLSWCWIPLPIRMKEGEMVPYILASL